MSLEDAIRQAMLHEEVQAINIFRNDNGVFQANVGYRESGAYKIERHEDPAKAMALALKKRKKVSIIADQFEDLL